MNFVKNIAFFGLLVVGVQAFGADGENGGVPRLSPEQVEYLAATGALARMRFEDNVSPEQLAAVQARVDLAGRALYAARAEQGMQRMQIQENLDHRNR